MQQIPEQCPLCGRALVEGSSINRHHLIPKTFGGKESFWLHVVCHNKIHSLFTERELLRQYNTFEALREYPDIQRFIEWLSKKEPTFRTRHQTSKRKRS